jgi:hypothetical protein
VKGQKVKPGKQGSRWSGEVNGCAWKKQRQRRRKAKKGSDKVTAKAGDYEDKREMSVNG